MGDVPLPARCASRRRRGGRCATGPSHTTGCGGLRAQIENLPCRFGGPLARVGLLFGGDRPAALHARRVGPQISTSLPDSLRPPFFRELLLPRELSGLVSIVLGPLYGAAAAAVAAATCAAGHRRQVPDGLQLFALDVVAALAAKPCEMLVRLLEFKISQVRYRPGSRLRPAP
jgi:hypothetical protein